MARPIELNSKVKSTSVKAQSAVKSQAHPHHLNWLERFVPWILIVCGLIGLFASLGLAIEEFHHLKHPASSLICDINPIVGCGAALDNWQGHAIGGIPNEFFGIAVFTVVATIGFSILAGARYKRWFWQGLQIGLFMGLAFVLWFMYQSVYVLNHLCPFCMVTWLATIVAFWYLLLYSVRAEHIRLHGSLARINHFIQKHHLDILVFGLLVITAVILNHFWYYFGKHI